MLAAVAIKIELPPSMHALLAERKAAIEKHLERDGSPLKGKVRLFYQQGSVAIGATIRAKFRFEGFDIDIIVELTTPGMTPWQALELLYEAMRGERGSRYYDMTERQTRCPSAISSPSPAARSALRRTSGNQPLPLRRRSASVAISPFFR